MVAVRDEKGKVKLHQIHNMTAAGAVSGSFWGLLIGLIFMNPLLGLAAGAASGALSGALTDVGIDGQSPRPKRRGWWWIKPQAWVDQLKP